MKLLTKTIRDKMIANGKAQYAVRGTEDEIDFEPVVKLFNPCGAGTWLLTELDSEDPDIAFGLGIERDLHWSPKKTLMGYAREAWQAGRIIA